MASAVLQGFPVLQLWVQEGAAQPALAEPCPCPASESFLNVGDAVVRRQDTSRARVQVTEPLVGDVRVTPDSSPISQPWKPRLELRRTESAFPGHVFAVLVLRCSRADKQSPNVNSLDIDENFC